MDKFVRSFDPHSSEQDDPAWVAESIRRDFSELLSMLDEQLGSLADGQERTRPHLLEAKAAAQRGLLLSTQLIELLRVSN